MKYTKGQPVEYEGELYWYGGIDNGEAKLSIIRDSSADIRVPLDGIKPVRHPYHGKKVRVWDENKGDSGTYVLIDAYDGCCAIVNPGEESAFREGKYFRIATMNHWEPIPEPAEQTLPLTPEEITRLRVMLEG